MEVDASKICRLIVIGIAGMLVCGCVLAPERVSPPDKYVLVKEGETLWTIARRYGWDHEVLARLNGISEPYLIYPDQKIYLPVEEILSGNDRLAGVMPKTAAADNKVQWQWPVTGDMELPVLGKQSIPGVYIRSSSGSVARAAAVGRVAYAGPGPRGGGWLVIIRHPRDFMSTYGDNARLYVREGQEVKRGQKIARIKTNVEGEKLLHFALYRGGQAVDPRIYLPPR